MKIRLHYVNSKRLYGAEAFEKEARALGVNRCLPLGFIKHIKWGENILLATFEPKVLAEGRDGRGNKRGGTAHVFGYFTVSGLSYIASAEFREAFTSLLCVTGSSERNETIQRQCGSYMIGRSCIISDNIEDVICKAQNLAEERGEKVKFFVSGAFTPTVLTITPASFSRALITVETNIEPENITADIIKLVNKLENYSKRTYIKTQAKAGRPRKEQ